jgi:LmbE family N-acetylglucosaminyl deacetylase
LRILCIGAHPDDCEIEFGGTAFKFAQRGDAVKFVSMTNGDAGHHRHPARELARIRAGEAAEAARRLGIAESEILHCHDGALLPHLEDRDTVIRLIREWRADLVFSHRAWDYHPDHRYTGQLVQDAAFLVVVPRICPAAAPLRVNPVFFYLEDSFRTPAPFAPDISVSIDDVWERKLDAIEAHASQVFEWLPWLAGVEESVPAEAGARRNWLAQQWKRPLSAAARERVERRYGHAVERAESFQLCEYGRQLTPAELDGVFPR